MRPAITYKSNFLVLLLFSCGGQDTPEHYKESQNAIRKHVGFYTSLNDGIRYDGGYTGTNSLGLRFQIVAPKHLIRPEEHLPMCGRLLTDQGAIINGTPECGADWEKERSRKPSDDMVAYQQVASEFLAFLDSTPAPPDFALIWEELRFYVYRFSIEKLVWPATPRVVVETSPFQMTSNELAEAGKQEERVRGTLRAAFRADYYGLGLCDGEVSEEPENISLPDPPLNSYELRYVGGIGISDPRLKRLAQSQENPNYEYCHQVEIWAQYFEAGGITTGSEHSSVFGIVLRRAINTNEPWQSEREYFTHNHGARPGQGRMRIKRTCLLEQMPITPGYYIWGGECEGSWLIDHTCNDDTAYQIRSAHGIWTDLDDKGEGLCRGRRRYNPPNCSVPW